METGPKGREIVRVADRAAWREWLAAHHATSPSVWLAMRKGHGASLSYDDAVEEALCFGWVDSQVLGLDDSHYLMLVAPRKRGSTWSGPNKARVERLRAEGLMTPAGEEKIAAALADGSWTSLDAAEAEIVPEDLAAVLDRERWDALSPFQRKQTLMRVYLAKRPETRARRIEQLAAIINRGERPY